jgi:putative effector of murein hydrolase
MPIEWLKLDFSHFVMYSTAGEFVWKYNELYGATVVLILVLYTQWQRLTYFHPSISLVVCLGTLPVCAN